MVKNALWICLTILGILGVTVATWLTIRWARAGGVFVGVLVTYPLGGLGGVIAASAGMRIGDGTWERSRRVTAELIGGTGGFLAHTAGYLVANGSADPLAVFVNTIGVGLLIAGIATFLVEACDDAVRSVVDADGSV